MFTNDISVDCVILGFDGKELNVLLVNRSGEENGKVFHDMKLPGSLIGSREDLDDAAHRVLKELTGLERIEMMQFKAFGSKDRTKDPKDVHWLEHASSLKIDRIVTIAYVALIRIDRKINSNLDDTQALWMPVKAVPSLAFDHNQILNEAVLYIAGMTRNDISILFGLLPAKFTVPQFKTLCETTFGKKLDARNFYKKLANLMPYVVPLDEKEKGTSHRAARYYRFDKTIYKKTKF